MVKTLELRVSLIVAGMAVAACHSSSDSQAKRTGAAGSGHVSAVKACELLSQDEIKQATGAAMGSGQLQTTDTQASCDWSAPDGTAGASGVGIIVRDFDDSLWQAMSTSKHATPVTGIGERAFKGTPHSGDLSVKQGPYEVDVGIVDFKHDDATVDAAAMKLMKLVLSRL
jgi:hypothetical protein